MARRAYIKTWVSARPGSRRSAGFTLVEILLYLALSSAMLTIIVTFLFVLMQSRIKNQTIAEVEQQGLQVMQLITNTTRNAEAILTPAAGVTSTSLSLQVAEAAKSPTVFDISDGALTVTEGASDPITITSPLVTASDVSFQNLSATGTPGSLRVSFTLSRTNVDGKSEYDYSQTFYGSSNIRR